MEGSSGVAVSVSGCWGGWAAAAGIWSWLWGGGRQAPWPQLVALIKLLCCESSCSPDSEQSCAGLFAGKWEHGWSCFAMCWLGLEMYFARCFGSRSGLEMADIECALSVTLGVSNSVFVLGHLWAVFMKWSYFSVLWPEKGRALPLPLCCEKEWASGAAKLRARLSLLSEHPCAPASQCFCSQEMKRTRRASLQWHFGVLLLKNRIAESRRGHLFDHRLGWGFSFNARCIRLPPTKQGISESRPF